MLTQARVKELFIYEDGGILRRRQSAGGKRAGTVAGAIHGTVKENKGYRVVGVDGEKYPASHIVWLYANGRLPPCQIDHRDLDRANDRIENLREAGPSGQGANKRAYRTSASGIKGVHRFRNRGRLTNRWRAQIKKDGRVRHLGLFDSPEEAALAYAAAAREAHGEFARIA